VAGGREPAHVHPDLGDDLRGGVLADAGDLIELGHLDRERGQRLIDPPGQLLDLGGQGVDPVEHHLQQVAVVVAEVPGQRLPQRADLAAQAVAGQPSQRGRVALPGHQRVQHRPAKCPNEPDRC
jgi:hypothetical protein